jgi:hypothetical protein
MPRGGKIRHTDEISPQLADKFMQTLIEGHSKLLLMEN